MTSRFKAYMYASGASIVSATNCVAMSYQSYYCVYRPLFNTLFLEFPALWLFGFNFEFYFVFLNDVHLIVDQRLFNQTAL